MAKIEIVSFSKAKLKIQLSPKLTQNIIDWNIHLLIIRRDGVNIFYIVRHTREIKSIVFF